MPPSQLKIATDVLSRLIKEEASYHKEAESQKKRIAALEQQQDDQDENREFRMKQEVCLSQAASPWTNIGQKQALEETNAIFPSMRERIANAREKLQAALESGTNETEIENAKKVLATAIESQKNDPDSAHPTGQPQWLVDWALSLRGWGGCTEFHPYGIGAQQWTCVCQIPREIVLPICDW